MSKGERVHSLAKRLGVSSTELIEKLNKKGVEVKSHMNVLDEKAVEIALKIYPVASAGKDKKTAKKPASSSKDKKTVKGKDPKEKKTPKKKEEEKKRKSGKEKTQAAKTPPKTKEKTAKKPAKKAKETDGIKVKDTSTPEKKSKPILVKKEEKTSGKAKKSKPSVDSVVKKEEPAEQKILEINEGATVKEVSETFGVSSGDIIGKLIGLGVMANINQSLDADTIEILGATYDVEVNIVKLAEDVVEEEEEDEENLEPRPPVVTIMGHVDHGKTSLLDAIRETNVMGGESGGITQHVGAYHVEHEKGTVVFLDTPGHHAFTAMRARGAQVTDIVVLIVAADDGVMPQTIEAINHAKAAKVPIIVAVNKVDKPNADPQKVRNTLSEFDLVPEEWGGDTIFVDISAKQRIKINDLLELIILQSEMLELKANPRRKAVGIVIESKLDKKKGPVATVLVEKGTLRVGDPFVSGVHSGKVRAILNDKGKRIISATPSIPVLILGFSGVPEAGDTFVVTDDEKKARQTAVLRMQKQRETSLTSAKKISLEELSEQIKNGIAKELKIIIKSDVHGSSQAIEDSINKLSTADVKVNIIHSGTGGVNESDVILASASNAIIIGFNVRPADKASAFAEQENVDMHFYTVIYDLIDDIKSAMEGLLDPTIKENQIGRAQVREVFQITKVGKIAGSYVLEGKIERAADVRLVRDSIIIYEGKLASLKRFKDDVKEVASGYECGIRIENFNDIKVDDIVEAFVKEEVKRKL